MLREVVFLLLIMAAGTGGELCVARAMKSVGTSEFRPAALLRIVCRAITVGWMWLGLSLMTIAFFSLLEMLSMENVSFVIPVTALSYAFGALGGEFFLGEQVTRKRWVGVLLVCIGVGFVCIGKR